MHRQLSVQLVRVCVNITLQSPQLQSARFVNEFWADEDGANDGCTYNSQIATR